MPQRILVEYINNWKQGYDAAIKNGNPKTFVWPEVITNGYYEGVVSAHMELTFSK